MEREIETALPKAFVEKMQGLLGEEADDFFKSYEKTRSYGLRINPLKCGDELPVYAENLKKIPWAKEGYYYEEDMRPGKHPFHDAGVYYIQEPSAMAVAEALNPKAGEKILDLCAAPGGKSTHLAGKMNQKGLLVCNEIHPARAKILSQNIERMGIANAVVTNMEPTGLVETFCEFFDGIVVDAPCSGEGMFRKDENARNEWSPDQVTLCANRQDGILDCAAKMLAPGGRIAYSTCTFSPEENEQAVVRFLERHPEFHAEKPECAKFFSEGHADWAGENAEAEKTVRIWPHRVDGEGHFLAVLRKDGVREEVPAVSEKKKKNDRKSGKKKADPGLEEFYAFGKELLNDTGMLTERRRFLTFGENLYLVPEETPELAGLKVLRPGLHVGVLKKGRMEPSHALALYLKKEEVTRFLEIGTGTLAERYLKGETIPIGNGEVSAEAGKPHGTAKGWMLVTCGGYSIGFGKADKGVLKNHYPKGLRRS